MNNYSQSANPNATNSELDAKKIINMTNLTLSKEELCLISIALNEYQCGSSTYHQDEMRKVSSKIDNHYKQLITN